MRGRKHHSSRRSHWRSGYSETGPPGSEGGHAEKDLNQVPRCVADPTRTVREQFLVEIGSGRELDDLTQLVLHQATLGR
jgi:hypothetical protein